MKINNFRDELTDISAKKEALAVARSVQTSFGGIKVFIHCHIAKGGNAKRKPLSTTLLAWSR